MNDQDRMLHFLDSLVDKTKLATITPDDLIYDALDTDPNMLASMDHDNYVRLVQDAEAAIRTAIQNYENPPSLAQITEIAESVESEDEKKEAEVPLGVAYGVVAPQEEEKKQAPIIDSLLPKPKPKPKRKPQEPEDDTRERRTMRDIREEAESIGFLQFTASEEELIERKKYLDEVDQLEATLPRKKIYQCEDCGAKFSGDNHRTRFFKHLRNVHAPGALQKERQQRRIQREFADDIEDIELEEEPEDIIAYVDSKSEDTEPFLYDEDTVPERPSKDIVPQFPDDSVSSSKLTAAYDIAKSVEAQFLRAVKAQSMPKDDSRNIFTLLYNALNLLYQIKNTYTQATEEIAPAHNLTQDLYNYFLDMYEIFAIFMPGVAGSWEKTARQRFIKAEQANIDVMEILKEIKQPKRKRAKKVKEPQGLKNILKYAQKATLRQDKIDRVKELLELADIENDASVSIFLVNLLKNPLTFVEDPDFIKFRKLYYVDPIFIRFFNHLSILQKIIFILSSGAIEDVQQMIQYLHEHPAYEGPIPSRISYRNVINTMRAQNFNQFMGIDFISKFPELFLSDYLARGKWFHTKGFLAALNKLIVFGATFYISSDADRQAFPKPFLVPKGTDEETYIQSIIDNAQDITAFLVQKAREVVELCNDISDDKVEEVVSAISTDSFSEILQTVIFKGENHNEDLDSISAEDLADVMEHLQTPDELATEQAIIKSRMNIKNLAKLAVPVTYSELIKLANKYTDDVRNEARQFKLDMQTRMTRTEGSHAKKLILEELKAQNESGKITPATYAFLEDFLKMYDTLDKLPTRKMGSFTRLTRLEDFPRYTHTQIEREAYLLTVQNEASLSSMKSLELEEKRAEIGEKQKERNRIIQISQKKFAENESLFKQRIAGMNVDERIASYKQFIHNYSDSMRKQIAAVNDDIYKLQLNFLQNDKLISEIYTNLKKLEEQQSKLRGFSVLPSGYDPRANDFINEIKAIKDKVRAGILALKLGTYIDVERVMKRFKDVMDGEIAAQKVGKKSAYAPERKDILGKKSEDELKAEKEEQYRGLVINELEGYLIQAATNITIDEVLLRYGNENTRKATFDSIYNLFSEYSKSENMRLLRSLENNNFNPIYRALTFYERTKVANLKSPLDTNITFPMRRARKQVDTQPRKRIAKALDISSLDSYTDVAFRTKPWLKYNSDWVWYIAPVDPAFASYLSYKKKQTARDTGSLPPSSLTPVQQKMVAFFGQPVGRFVGPMTSEVYKSDLLKNQDEKPPRGEIYAPTATFWRWYHKSFIRRFKSDCTHLYRDFFLGDNPTLYFGLVNTKTQDRMRLQDRHFIDECKYLKNIIKNKIEMIVGDCTDDNGKEFEGDCAREREQMISALRPVIKQIKENKKLVLEDGELSRFIVTTLISMCKKHQCKYSRCLNVLFTLIFLLSPNNKSSYFRDLFIVAKREGIIHFLQDIYNGNFHKLIPEFYLADASQRESMIDNIKILILDQMLHFAVDHHFLSSDQGSRSKYIATSEDFKDNYILKASKYNLDFAVSAVNKDLKEIFVSSRKDNFRNICANASNVTGDVVFYYVDANTGDLMCAGWEQIQQILNNTDASVMHGLSPEAISEVRQTFTFGEDDLNASIREMTMYLDSILPKRITEELMDEIALMNQDKEIFGRLMDVERYPMIKAMVDKVHAGFRPSDEVLYEYVYSEISARYWAGVMDVVQTYLNSNAGKKLLDDFRTEGNRRAQQYGAMLSTFVSDTHKENLPASIIQAKKEEHAQTLTIKSRNDRTARYELLDQYYDDKPSLLAAIVSYFGMTNAYFVDNIVDYLTQQTGVNDITLHEDPKQTLCEFCSSRYATSTVVQAARDASRITGVSAGVDNLHYFTTVHICNEEKCMRKMTKKYIDQPVSLEAQVVGELVTYIKRLVAPTIENEELIELLKSLHMDELLEQYNITELWEQALLSLDTRLYTDAALLQKSAEIDAIFQIFFPTPETVSFAQKYADNLTEHSVDEMSESEIAYAYRELIDNRMSQLGDAEKAILAGNNSKKDKLRQLLDIPVFSDKCKQMLKIISLREKLTECLGLSDFTTYYKNVLREKLNLQTLDVQQTDVAIQGLIRPWTDASAILTAARPGLSDDFYQLLVGKDAQQIVAALINRRFTKWDTKGSILPEAVVTARRDLIARCFNRFIVNIQKTAEKYRKANSITDPVVQLSLLLQNAPFVARLKLYLDDIDIHKDTFIYAAVKAKTGEIMPGCVSITKDKVYDWMRKHLDRYRMKNIRQVIEGKVPFGKSKNKASFEDKKTIMDKVDEAAANEDPLRRLVELLTELVHTSQHADIHDLQTKLRGLENKVKTMPSLVAQVNAKIQSLDLVDVPTVADEKDAAGMKAVVEKVRSLFYGETFDDLFGRIKRAVAELSTMGKYSGIPELKEESDIALLSAPLDVLLSKTKKTSVKTKVNEILKMVQNHAKYADIKSLMELATDMISTDELQRKIDNLQTDIQLLSGGHLSKSEKERFEEVEQSIRDDLDKLTSRIADVNALVDVLLAKCTAADSAGIVKIANNNDSAGMIGLFSSVSALVDKWSQERDAEDEALKLAIDLVKQVSVIRTAESLEARLEHLQNTRARREKEVLNENPLSKKDYLMVQQILEWIRTHEHLKGFDFVKDIVKEFSQTHPECITPSTRNHEMEYAFKVSKGFLRALGIILFGEKSQFPSMDLKKTKDVEEGEEKKSGEEEKKSGEVVEEEQPKKKKKLLTERDKKKEEGRVIEDEITWWRRQQRFDARKFTKMDYDIRLTGPESYQLYLNKLKKASRVLNKLYEGGRKYDDALIDLIEVIEQVGQVDMQKVLDGNALALDKLVDTPLWVEQYADWISKFVSKNSATEPEAQDPTKRSTWKKASKFYYGMMDHLYKLKSNTSGFNFYGYTEESTYLNIKEKKRALAEPLKRMESLEKLRLVGGDRAEIQKVLDGNSDNQVYQTFKKEFDEEKHSEVPDFDNLRSDDSGAWNRVYKKMYEGIYKAYTAAFIAYRETTMTYNLPYLVYILFTDSGREHLTNTIRKTKEKIEALNSKYGEIKDKLDPANAEVVQLQIEEIDKQLASSSSDKSLLNAKREELAKLIRGEVERDLLLLEKDKLHMEALQLMREFRAHKNLFNMLHSAKQITAHKMGMMMSGGSVPVQQMADVADLNNFIRLSLRADRDMIYQRSYLEGLLEMFVKILQMPSETFDVNDVKIAEIRQNLVSAAEMGLFKHFKLRKDVESKRVQELEMQQVGARLKPGYREDPEEKKYYEVLKGVRKSDCTQVGQIWRESKCLREVNEEEATIPEMKGVMVTKKVKLRPRKFVIEAPTVVYMTANTLVITRPPNIPELEGRPDLSFMASWKVGDQVPKSEFDFVVGEIHKYFDAKIVELQEQVDKEKGVIKKKKLSDALASKINGLNTTRESVLPLAEEVVGGLVGEKAEYKAPVRGAAKKTAAEKKAEKKADKKVEKEGGESLLDRLKRLMEDEQKQVGPSWLSNMEVQPPEWNNEGESDSESESEFGTGIYRESDEEEEEEEESDENVIKIGESQLDKLRTIDESDLEDYLRRDIAMYNVLVNTGEKVIKDELDPTNKLGKTLMELREQLFEEFEEDYEDEEYEDEDYEDEEDEILDEEYGEDGEDVEDDE